MKKIFYFLCVVIAINLVSCSNEIENVTDPQHEMQDVEDLFNEEIVVQERVDKGPVKLRLEVPKATKSEFLPSGPIYLLGRSYQAKNRPLSNVDNLSYHVVDIIKLAEDHKYTMITTSRLKLDLDYFSYASFSKYEKNSLSTSKVKRNSGLDLGVFKIGSEKTITETFTSNYVNQDNMVFGELNVNYIGHKYDLQITNATLDEIRKKYVNSVFLKDLYNYPLYETLESYGGHVLASFYAGGRLTALYAGRHRSSNSVQTKENDMEAAINASFTIEDDKGNEVGSGNMDQGIGGKYSNKASINKSFSELRVSVKAEGGIPSTIIAGSAQKIENVEITVNDWLKSLADQKLHTLSDINNEGLVPITEFIEEENYKVNIKRIIEKTNSGGIFYFKDLREPFVTINYTTENPLFNTTLQKGGPQVYLRTRTGEEIKLLDRSKDNTYRYNIDYKDLGGSTKQIHDYYVSISKDILAKEISPYFKCKVTVRSSNSSLFGEGNGVMEDLFYSRLDAELTALVADFQSARKYEDKQRGFKYILLKRTGTDSTKDIALSMYDDYLLDTYGIREWYNKMPSEDMSYDNLLRTHRIIGL